MLNLMSGWYETIMDFTFDIHYIKGILNVLPDALSRLYEKELDSASKAVKFWPMSADGYNIISKTIDN